MVMRQNITSDTSNNNIKYELKHKERKPAVKTNRKILTQNITPTC